MKLRTKFVALLVPLVVAPLAFVGHIAYTQLRISAEQRVFDDVHDRLSDLRADNELIQRQMVASVRMFAQSAELDRYVDGDPAPFVTLIERYANSYTDFTGLRLVAPNGHVELAHDGASGPLDDDAMISAVERRRLLAVDGGSLLQVQEASGTLEMTVSTSVQDAEGKVMAFVFLSRKLSGLTDAVVNGTLGERGYFLVADAGGAVRLGHSERAPARLPARVDFSDWQQLSTLRQSRRVDMADERYFVEGVSLQDGLYLFALQPESQVVARSRQFGVTMAIVTLLAVLVAVATLLLALHHIVVHPIKQIQRAADAIRRGDFAARPMAAARDEIGDLAASLGEMSASLRDSNDHVEYLARHDTLTGLPNRAMFREELQRAIDVSRQGHQRLAVLCLDLDDFKRINDTLGHQVGDEILRRFSQSIAEEVHENYRLSRISDVEPEHLIARLGGDEFIILLRNVVDDYVPRNVARRIIESISEPFVLRGHELHISTSVGVTLYPADALTADDLIKNADAALHQAKTQGKNTYQYFSPSMNEAAHRRLMLETRLRKALNTNQFELYYQPKVNPQTLEILGAEALLRWHDPDGNIVQPADFIPVAEDTGLILPIGEWVLNEACRQLKRWQDSGLPGISLSVNVSAIQVSRQDLNYVVRKALRESDIDAACLDIEITESALISGGDNAAQILDELRKLGVSLSLDDFGTGYSSLSYLRRFPVDNLKIDRSFMNEIDEKDSSRSIVAAMIAMSKSLDMTVTAEGVENEDQLDFLCAQGCDYAQGYLISRPVPAADFERLLTAADWRPSRRRGTT